jgi:type II secretory pathway pseudopilin PulG
MARRGAKSTHLWRRAKRQDGRHRGGYTIVEVVISLALLAVGATGVIAMQKATLLGTVRARNLTTANAVAATWLERLRVDALRWKLSDAGLNTIESTLYLKNVGNDFPSLSSKEDIWFRPVSDKVLGYTPTADVRGMDVTKANQAAFCTNLKLTQLLPNLIRAEVRVFWLRTKGGGQSNTYAGTINNKPLCDGGSGYLKAVTSAHDRYHVVTITSALMRNDAS